MAEAPPHRQVVAAFLTPARAGSNEALFDRFERGFAAVWARTEVTLGNVTLTAIAERVLHTTAERHGWFGALSIEPGGLDSRALRERLATLPRAELERGVEELLSELLIVLGSLTAEILTPALHAALTKVAIGDERTRNEASS